MKPYITSLLAISLLSSAAFAHDDEGPEIDKDGNVIFHQQLTHNVSPIMPPTARQSGYCCVILDVLETGRVEKPEVLYCSNPVFWGVTERTAPKITYEPRIINGTPVRTKDVLEYFSFRLTDQHGKLIKNDEGYSQFDQDNEHVTNHYCHQYVT